MVKRKSAFQKKRTLRSKDSLWKKIFKFGLISSLWGGIALATLLAWHAYNLPDITNLETSVRRPSIVFLTQDHKEIAIQGDVHGETVSLKQVPKPLVQALMATEDHHFYDHLGIDFKGLLRAVVRNVVAGRYVQGGSTITQQLAKNLFLTPNRSLHRKIKEMMLAFWLEHHFSKDQILTIYLNRVFLGNQTYGVDAAAQQYFGKLVSHLNTAECAVIVALLKAPSRFGRNHDLLRKRGSIVLRNMLEEGYLSEDQYESFLKRMEKLRFYRNPYGNNHRYFTDWVLSEVGERVSMDQDLIVTTTVDLSLQNIAIQKIKESIAANHEKFNVETAAFLAMSYDGAVRAVVGGHNYNYNQFNIAIQAQRQSGSIFKAFIFLAALESGFKTSLILSDKVYTNRGWTVNNYGWKTRGEVTLEDALVYSINTATVRLAQKVGVGTIMDVAEKLGFSKPLAQDLTIALGTGETSLLELVQAFTTIANHGEQIEPYGVLEIRSSNGKILYKRESSEQRKKDQKVFKEDNIRTLEDILERAVEVGTAKKARIPGVVVRGKTGTSQRFRDAWFVGYLPGLVAGVWMGNLDDSPMNRLVGGNLPTSIWAQTMKKFRGRR